MISNNSNRSNSGHLKNDSQGHFFSSKKIRAKYNGFRYLLQNLISNGFFLNKKISQLIIDSLVKIDELLNNNNSNNINNSIILLREKLNEILCMNLEANVQIKKLQSCLLKSEDLFLKEVMTLNLNGKFDNLTSLRNRNAFNEDLLTFYLQNRDFILIDIDLNNVKFINDTYGHNKGDEMLINFSKVLLSDKLFNNNGNDEYLNLIYRKGGDEFTIISFESEEIIKAKIDLLKTWLKKRKFEILYEGKKIKHEIRFGYGYLKINYENGDSLDDFLDKVDILMYIDKRREKIRIILEESEKFKQLLEEIEKCNEIIDLNERSKKKQGAEKEALDWVKNTESLVLKKIILEEENFKKSEKYINLLNEGKNKKAQKLLLDYLSKIEKEIIDFYLLS